jgi:hypothetical protein
VISKREDAVKEQGRFQERKQLEDRRKLQKQREVIERLRQQTDQARTTQGTAESGEEEEEEENQPLPTPEEYAQQLADLEGKRQTELDQLNEEVEELIKKNDATQKTIGERWDRKMNRITEYTQRLRKKEKALLQIGEHEEGILELQQKLETLERQKQQLMKRRKESVKFSSELEAENSKQIRENANLEGKAREITESQQANLARKREIVEREKDLDQREQEVFEEEQAVLELEGQLEDINAKAAEAVGELNAEKASMDDTILSLTMGDVSND